MTWRARSGRPRVQFLANLPCWAYDFVARSVAARLRHRFDIDIAYTSQRPQLDPERYDLLYVFYWADPWYRRAGTPPERTVVEVASHRWATDDAFGRLSPRAFIERYLADCAFATTPALFLHEMLAAEAQEIYHCPNGYEPGLFAPPRRRTGPLRIGWVGNPADESKGLDDVLRPACNGRFDLRSTGGDWSRTRVARFYRQVDVLAVASIAESQPLPLIEAMASGCYIVTTPVGVAPELIRDRVNGRIVERTPEAFRAAFDACEADLAAVRRAGRMNAAIVRDSRSWDVCALRYGEVLDHALTRAAGGVAEPPQARVPPPPIVQALHGTGSATVPAEAATAGQRSAAARIAALRWGASDTVVRFRSRFTAMDPGSSVRRAAARVLPQPVRAALRRLIPRTGP